MKEMTRSRKGDPQSGSDSTESESPQRRRSSSSHRSSRRRKRSRSRRRSSSDDGGGSSGSGSHDHRRKGTKGITEDQIREYMSKKLQKQAVKVAKKLKTQDVSGYSNDSNPFGDSNLTEKFVWRKKIERDVIQGQPVDVSLKAEKKRQRERMAEIEKVKKRREERAIEKAQHEEEMAMLARERARAEFHDWEQKEEEFHFVQSKARSQIRVREGRMKPIDILSKNLNGSEDFDIEINEPYMVFKGLSAKEMEELREDINMYLDKDRETETHIEFWEALMLVCNWELVEARKRDAIDRARVHGEEPPAEVLVEDRYIHPSIEAEVKSVLEGKTSSELELMERKIEGQMKSGKAKVVEFWDAVSKHLHIYKAKARLKEIHTNLLRKHLQRLEQPAEMQHAVKSEGLLTIKEEDVMQDDDDAQTYSPEPMIEPKQEPEEEPGSFSPQLLHGTEDEDAIDPEEDRAELDRNREAVVVEQKRIQDTFAAKPAPADDKFELKAIKAMGPLDDGDAVFGTGAEVSLDSQVYWWHDKYRPRKPKYFNRVHTGYEWNKYNQTHYDHDNPPPKVVQGYKFNIFYPDLVDKSAAPTYTIDRDGRGSNGETCLIRFHAGPPYEDIAFRIVNKEWEYSHKKGFKCTFERGILHIYFNFKRYRYRR